MDVKGFILKKMVRANDNVSVGVLVRVGVSSDVIVGASATIRVSVGTCVGEAGNGDGVNGGANVVMRVRGNGGVNVGGNVDVRDCVILGMSLCA